MTTPDKSITAQPTAATTCPKCGSPEHDECFDPPHPWHDTPHDSAPDEGTPVNIPDAQLMASILHYPQCWDTAVFPDVWSALREMAERLPCCKPSAPVAGSATATPSSEGVEPAGGGDTPRTDAMFNGFGAWDEPSIKRHSPAAKHFIELSRILERELAAANAKITELETRLACAREETADEALKYWWRKWINDVISAARKQP